jgi:hypothetical protein
MEHNIAINRQILYRVSVLLGRLRLERISIFGIVGVHATLCNYMRRRGYVI